MAQESDNPGELSQTRKLVEAALCIEYDDLGAEDRLAVRTLLLDHLGVTVRGARTESAAAFRRFVGALDYKTTASLPIVGVAAEAPPVLGAMANAVAGHSIEFDDVHSAASSHPGVVIFPAALAAAVIADADSAAFVRGAVIGYEVMCRIGRAANPSSHYARHFHPTGTTGALGAAACAGAVLGLDVDGVVAAVGIASSMASGSLQFLVDGAWTKRLHPTLAARNGIEAALLAREGYKGTEDGVTGSRGFLAAYSDAPRPDLLLEGFGVRPLEVRNTSLKAHTCCRYNQGPIDALLQIRKEHELESGKIASVMIGIPTAAVGLVAEPATSKRRPQSVVDAQFSLQYGAAVAIARGRAGLDEYDESKLDDPELRRLMELVDYVVDPDIDRTYPEQWRAWAQVRTTDGRTLEARIDDPKGDPTNPLSAGEVSEKFRDLTSPTYSMEWQREVESVVSRMGEPGTIGKLLDLLSCHVGV